MPISVPAVYRHCLGLAARKTIYLQFRILTDESWARKKGTTPNQVIIAEQDDKQIKRWPRNHCVAICEKESKRREVFSISGRAGEPPSMKKTGSFPFSKGVAVSRRC